jgi:hypothetical protein
VTDQSRRPAVPDIARSTDRATCSSSVALAVAPPSTELVPICPRIGYLEENAGRHRGRMLVVLNAPEGFAARTRPGAPAFSSARRRFQVRLASRAPRMIAQLVVCDLRHGSRRPVRAAVPMRYLMQMSVRDRSFACQC